MGKTYISMRDFDRIFDAAEARDRETMYGLLLPKSLTIKVKRKRRKLPDKLTIRVRDAGAGTGLAAIHKKTGYPMVGGLAVPHLIGHPALVTKYRQTWQTGRLGWLECPKCHSQFSYVRGFENCLLRHKNLTIQEGYEYLSKAVFGEAVQERPAWQSDLNQRVARGYHPIVRN